MFSDTIPSRIQYKYQDGGENSIKSLKNNYFWFSSPTALNDPHELRYKADTSDNAIKAYFVWHCYQHKFTKKERDEGLTAIHVTRYLKKVACERLKTHLGTAKELVRGIFSTTSNCESPIMWAHYAADHKGWSIGFKINKIFYYDDHGRIFPIEVTYGNDIPLVTWPMLTEDQFNEGIMASRALVPIYTTKAKGWEYEEETRCILFGSGFEEITKIDRMVPFNTAAVTEIIFGMYCCEDKKIEVYEITKEWNISYFTAEPKQDSYLMGKTPWSN